MQINASKIIFRRHSTDEFRLLDGQLAQVDVDDVRGDELAEAAAVTVTRRSERRRRHRRRRPSRTSPSADDAEKTSTASSQHQAPCKRPKALNGIAL